MNNGLSNISVPSLENDTETTVNISEALDAIQSPMDNLIWVNEQLFGEILFSVKHYFCTTTDGNLYSMDEELEEE